MDLRERINAAKQTKLKKPPKGMLTALQWAEKWDMDVHRVREILKEGVKLGIVKIQNYNVIYVDGRIHHCPHYAEIGK